MTDTTADRPTTSTPSPERLLEAAGAIAPYLVDVRRRLHRHPEVGLGLPWTQAAVAAAVRELGLEPRLGKSVGSVVAVIEGARPGPTIVLRADMDGLPLHEDTGLEFASEVDGTMHACGHDTHVAMLLGGARLLLHHRDSLAGRVILMLQPGEEGYHGARYMLEDGLLEVAGDAPVTGAFALHISAKDATGVISVRPGPMLASADVLRMHVRGRGGHASAPHLAVDPITVAAEIVLGLQTMVTRRTDVFDPAVVTIAHIEAGTTNNIIPESVFLEGTMRTVSEATREATKAQVRQVVDGICAAHGAAAELEIEPGYPVTVNDPGFTGFVLEAARDLCGEAAVLEPASPIMGAEDFSYVLQKVPGAMAFIGATPPPTDPKAAPQNHSNRVVFDEAAMPTGAALYALIALRHLAG